MENVSKGKTVLLGVPAGQALNVVTRELKWLTDNTDVSGIYPVFSPDGRKIAELRRIFSYAAGSDSRGLGSGPVAGHR